jgi:uncharacterized membrane protein YqjE
MTREIVKTRPLDGPGVSALPTRELLSRIAENVKELVTTEVKLAKAELKVDVKDEVAAAKGLGAGALLGYAGVILLLVTAAMGLANVMPAWAAGLIVAGVLLAAAAIAGLIGWRKRIKSPLGRTRRQVTETLAWAKGKAP